MERVPDPGTPGIPCTPGTPCTPPTSPTATHHGGFGAFCSAISDTLSVRTPGRVQSTRRPARPAPTRIINAKQNRDRLTLRPAPRPKLIPAGVASRLSSRDSINSPKTPINLTASCYFQTHVARLRVVVSVSTPSIMVKSERPPINSWRLKSPGWNKKYKQVYY